MNDASEFERFGNILNQENKGTMPTAEKIYEQTV
jgi:hypothetical protein